MLPLALQCSALTHSAVAAPGMPVQALWEPALTLPVRMQDFSRSGSLNLDADGSWEGVTSPSKASGPSQNGLRSLPALPTAQDSQPRPPVSESLSTPFSRHGPVSDSPTGTAESDSPTGPVPNGPQNGHVRLRKAVSVDMAPPQLGAGMPSTRSEDGERRYHPSLSAGFALCRRSASIKVQTASLGPTEQCSRPAQTLTAAGVQQAAVRR